MMGDVTVDVRTGKRTVSNEGGTGEVVSVLAVKAEARRRIMAIAPEWRQLNAIRESETAIFAKIDAIRAASDAIEAMDPIPLDYRSDAYWSGE